QRPLGVNEELGAARLPVVIAVEDDGIALADRHLIIRLRHDPAAPGSRLTPRPTAAAVARHLGRRGIATKNTKRHKKYQEGGSVPDVFAPGHYECYLIVIFCVFCGHFCSPYHGVGGPSRKLARESWSRSLTGRTRT